MDYLFLALTNPEDGRDADFNRWYDAHHVPEVLKYGRGFLSGRRYRLEPVGDGLNAFPWKYLACYTMTADDLRSYHEAPWTTPHPPLTPFRGLLRDDHAAWIYRPDSSDGSEQVVSIGDDLRQFVDSAHSIVWDLARVDAVREDDFHRWHEAHLESVRTVNGRPIARRRYVLADHQRPSQPVSYWKYLTVYAISDQVAHQVDTVVAAVRGQPGPPRLTDPWSERLVCSWTAISPSYVAASASPDRFKDQRGRT